MLFCEMLWEGVPVFVRRFDRTGFHPAFTRNLRWNRISGHYGISYFSE